MSIIDQKMDLFAPELIALSDRIWSYAESSLQEFRSAKDSADFLEKQGFTIERNIAGIETAFVATWGCGEPKLGFLAEYDALPGLSNLVAPYQEAIEGAASGHGCGHNLLGVACAAAVLCLKEIMTEQNIAGTIIYYGCPAEENYSAKVPMVAEGVFKGLAAAFAYHPSSLHNVSLSSSVANNSIKFTFKGRTAHAGGDPHNGRSALDAVELMNVGANYLREHVISDARIHYIITEGGKAPNIVPERAQVWYFIRAPKVNQLNEIVNRMKKVAQGAAMMTETEVEIVLESGVYNMLNNETLGRVVHQVMQDIPAPAWTDDELNFASEMIKSIPEAQLVAKLESLGEKVDATIPLATRLNPMDGKGKVMTGSTDVSDVSWQVPTITFGTACYPWAGNGHSWMVTACSGHSIGHKGMLYAGKIMIEASLRLLAKPGILETAQEEHLKSIAGIEYKPYGDVPLPKFINPHK